MTKPNKFYVVRYDRDLPQASKVISAHATKAQATQAAKHLTQVTKHVGPPFPLATYKVARPKPSTTTRGPSPATLNKENNHKSRRFHG